MAVYPTDSESKMAMYPEMSQAKYGRAHWYKQQII